MAVSVLIEKKRSQEVFLLTDSFLGSNALKKELAELYVAAIMAAMHWCWSLNKISSPAPWIRAVKRFSCNILSAAKKKWRGMALRLWYVCYNLNTALHIVSRISRSVVPNETTGGKESRAMTQRTVLRQVLKLSELLFVTLWSEADRTKKYTGPDILPHTVPLAPSNNSLYWRLESDCILHFYLQFLHFGTKWLNISSKK